MAALGQTFDATTVEPSRPAGEVIPPGDYVAQIVWSEMKQAKSGSGELLEVELEILEGEFARRHFWDQLNLVNASQQAQEIAQRTLSAICHATGVLRVNDSEALHFKPMLVKLAVIPAGHKEKSGYEHTTSKNRVQGYSPVNGKAQASMASPRPAPAVRPATAAPAAAAPAPAAPKSPPWGRRVA